MFYQVEERPRRLHPAIQITPPATVTVLLPVGFDPNKIEALLHRKARWLLKHLAQAEGAPVSSKAFVSGEGYRFLGREYRLNVILKKISTLATVDMVGEELIITIRESSPQGRQYPGVRSSLVSWYRHQAGNILRERVDKFSAIVGAKASNMRLTELKTRWGYCRSDGLIAFNWRIIQAPLPVIDYIIVHELVHLRHPHHRKDFWNAVRVIIPDYESHKGWLREHGAELYW